MESLLSLAFDNLSSSDSAKIRKGLRQVEGLLAQICVSKSKPGHQRRHSMVPTGAAAEQHSLAKLRTDLAYQEFFKLQNGFEWNSKEAGTRAVLTYLVAIRLIYALERLLGKGSNGNNDLLILSTLDLLQGLLLLHPPSRGLFARELYMNLLLDLLDDGNCPAIQAATLLTLVCALLDQPQNTRTFESLDGLLTITSLFKLRSTTRQVKIKVVEFLYFYLMPESSQDTPPSRPRRSSVVPKSKSQAAKTDVTLRSTEEKQNILGRYLNNVQDLVRDLRESAPFGGAYAR